MVQVVIVYGACHVHLLLKTDMLWSLVVVWRSDVGSVHGLWLPAIP